MRRAAPALLGLVLGGLCLGPALLPGYVLVQDMVFVPEPVFSRFAFGLAGGSPRAVPSDLVVTALAQVVPAWLVQKAVLLGIFVLGCAGAARLVPSASLAGRLVAGGFYVWNPYVAERLLMGQWALLLGYAGLPWVVAAVRDRRRVAVALLPAAVGGFAAMTVTAITALPVAAFVAWRSRTPRALLWPFALLAAGSLPWLVTALARPGGLTGDPVGVEAFAARADGPFGAVASLLSLGGVWNAWAVPAAFDTVPGAVARLTLVAAGVAGFALVRRERAKPGAPGNIGTWGRSEAPGRSGRRPGGRGVLGAEVWGGLVVAALAGAGIAVAGVGPGGRAVLKGLVEMWAGVAVFRDAQQFVAPLALLAAVGLGSLTARAASRWAAAMVLVPLAVLPTLAWGAAGRLEAVDYPRSWSAAREILRRDPAPGDVLVLPFESYRRYGWNGGRAVLDPAQRFFAVPGREVVVNDAVRVGSLVVGAEDPRARRLAERLADPGALAAEGIGFVVIDAGPPLWLPGLTAVLETHEIRLYRVVH
ncbi:hypothetical protein GCM10009560_66430 [Nonomuraea longicatena]|uniref:Uncharacterized protein n=1 Tax=Nonomuraea longicatena TaxID=83682 RepID=A0ABN1QXB9_9ACTN